MSWSVRVDPVKRVSHVTVDGTVTYSDLAAAQRALGEARNFSPEFPLLLDLRGADEVFLTREEMQALMTVSPLAGSTRRAILVDRPGVFGLAQAYETMREHQTATDVVRACRTLEDCARWLGLSFSEA